MVITSRIEQYYSAWNEAWDDHRISKVQNRSQPEVNFGVNDAIGTIVTKWDLTLFGKWIILSII